MNDDLYKNSILQSVKKSLGLAPDYGVFDQDIIMCINSAFSTLAQLGVGPEKGYYIEDEKSLWTDFLHNDARLSNVKSYVLLRTRLLFDPPSTSFGITAIKDQITELEWRLNVTVDNFAYEEERTA